MNFSQVTVETPEVSHDMYISDSSGPGVLLLHELPGLTSSTFALAERIAGNGFTVGVPHLFGRVGHESRSPSMKELHGLCVAREMSLLASNTPKRGTEWLSKAASQLKKVSASSRGVGVIGMCATGAFAMASVFDENVGAVVASQAAFPALRRSSWGIRGGDCRLATTTKPVMALRYERDVIAGKRRVTKLPRLLGEDVADPTARSAGEDVPIGERGIRVEEGKRLHIVWAAGAGHSVLNFDKVDEAIQAVIAFLDSNLRERRPADDPAGP